MNIGVIFAGGVGKRMHSKDRPKQFLEVYGKPIIIHTLEVFQNCDEIDAIVIACVEQWIDYLNKLVEKYRITKVQKIVKGGETGQLSIYNGLLAAKEVAKDNEAVVLIHDGVRPLITTDLLEANIESVKEYGSAITTSKVTETIIVIDDANRITTVPDRKQSRIAKAPQSFRLNDVLNAHNQAMKEGRTSFIDSCTMMKHYGYNLYLVDGPSQNIKITTPEDFYLMRAMIETKENEQLYSPSEIKE